MLSTISLFVSLPAAAQRDWDRLPSAASPQVLFSEPFKRVIAVPDFPPVAIPAVSESSPGSLDTNQTNSEPIVNRKPLLFVGPDASRGITIARVPLLQGQKAIALTFDDGPWQDTPQILQVLREHDVKATFFWTGHALQIYPQYANLVVQDGHAIGNHTWSHKYGQHTHAQAFTEVQNTGALIRKLTDVRTFLFRPPGGRLDNGLVAYAEQSNFTVVHWSIDAQDWRSGVTAAAIVQNVVREAHPGAIVLMHDGGGDRQATVAALPQIITQLKQQGYEFVTVPALLRRNVTL
ncbi:MAG: polysaccharide deacetylase family protein [Cyanobacteria bacterium P01_H01_bin.121]